MGHYGVNGTVFQQTKRFPAQMKSGYQLKEEQEKANREYQKDSDQKDPYKAQKPRNAEWSRDRYNTSNSSKTN